MKIYSIFLTFCVLNVDKLIDFKDTHSLKINGISVTFFVLNENKLTFSQNKHPLNINFILITFLVLTKSKFNIFNSGQKRKYYPYFLHILY